jgi:hypothetical protein
VRYVIDGAFALYYLALFGLTGLGIWRWIRRRKQ